MTTAWLQSTRRDVSARGMTPSTTPMPEGVGETMRNKYAIAKPAMIVPAVKGTSNERKEASKMPIHNALSSKPHKTGRTKLDGFAVSPESPSEISCANLCARVSLKY